MRLAKDFERGMLDLRGVGEWWGSFAVAVVGVKLTCLVLFERARVFVVGVAGADGIS